MKKTIIASITAVTMTFGALAGIAHADGKGGPKSAEDRVEKLTQRLDLSADQQSQLLAMFTKRDADREQMQATLTAEQRENMKANARDGMRDQMHKDIKSLLTAEQIAKFENMHSGEGKGGHGKGGKGGKH
ncbi:hypothetical protein [Marinobacterium sp. xm-d-564]|uniref:hypothetical protein n=1 Tax=Marinobacterium sp. xm-d-564 TaxID=2497742 RepID=UPI001567F48C|nr:hypothetical protein [Marinobacterium sp. xm-d-564]NRP59310.1 periplasmic repressor CpxP [Marinobacterium sp. xm-d-564]